MEAGLEAKLNNPLGGRTRLCFHQSSLTPAIGKWETGVPRLLPTTTGICIGVPTQHFTSWVSPPGSVTVLHFPLWCLSTQGHNCNLTQLQAQKRSLGIVGLFVASSPQGAAQHSLHGINDLCLTGLAQCFVTAFAAQSYILHILRNPSSF